MRKEVLIAIIIGFVLGLIITFGVWTANRAVRGNQIAEEETENWEEEESSENKTEKAAISLAINSPEDESLINTSSVELNGTTEPNAQVAIIYETGETIINADKKGEFTFNIPLELGTNEVKITAITESDEATKTLNLVYSKD